MLNGRYDYIVPAQMAERLYQGIGTPEDDKRIVIFDSGHWPLPRNQISREISDWLDRHFGRVE